MSYTEVCTQQMLNKSLFIWGSWKKEVETEIGVHFLCVIRKGIERERMRVREGKLETMDKEMYQFPVCG